MHVSLSSDQLQQICFSLTYFAQLHKNVSYRKDGLEACRIPVLSVPGGEGMSLCKVHAYTWKNEEDKIHMRVLKFFVTLIVFTVLICKPLLSLLFMCACECVCIRECVCPAMHTDKSCVWAAGGMQ